MSLQQKKEGEKKEEHRDYWAEGESVTLRQEPNGDWKPAIPEEYHSSWWDKIQCFVGFHAWSWTLPQEGNILIITDEIPDYAKCIKCNKTYL